MTSNTRRRIIGVSVNNNTTTDKTMTITTDAANETTTATTTLDVEHASFHRWGIGMVQGNIRNDGAQIFLGVQGEHGTTIRLKDDQERKVMAALLELMVSELRKGIK